MTTIVSMQTASRSIRRETAAVTQFTPTAGLERWQVRSIEKLAALAGLAENWDSYGSPAISEGLIDFATHVISRLVITGVPIPQIVPMHGGGIHLEFTRGARDVSIEIAANGVIDLLSSNDDAPSAYEPADVRSALQWVVAG